MIGPDDSSDSENIVAESIKVVHDFKQNMWANWKLTGRYENTCGVNDAGITVIGERKTQRRGNNKRQKTLAKQNYANGRQGGLVNNDFMMSRDERMVQKDSSDRMNSREKISFIMKSLISSLAKEYKPKGMLMSKQV